MSDTPRTDVAYLAAQESTRPLDFFAARARELETELSESNDKWAELFGKLKQANSRIEYLKHQSLVNAKAADNWFREVDNLSAALDGLLREIDGTKVAGSWDESIRNAREALGRVKGKL